MNLSNILFYFCFDPGGDGIEAVKMFKYASEKYDEMGLEGRYAVQVKISLTNGSRFTTEKKYPKGSNMEPLSSEEVVLKFKRLAGKVISEKKVDSILNLINNLEKVDNVNELDTMLLKE